MAKSGGGSLSPNFQSRGIAKKTVRCNIAQLDSSCAEKKEAAAACENSAGVAAVRVVQIFNPVLVRTDVANFRLLVQKLTGKSGCSKNMWNKLRRLSYLCEADVAQLPNAHLLEPEYIHECLYGDGQQAQLEEEEESGRCSCSLKVCADPNAAGAFSELDIYAGLVSNGPLPDITSLPPLPPVRSELSLCTL